MEFEGGAQSMPMRMLPQKRNIDYAREGETARVILSSKVGVGSRDSKEADFSYQPTSA